MSSKKMALDSQTDHQFSPQCGQALLACSQKTMRIVANIWAAHKIQFIPWQFKLTYFQPTSALSLLSELEVMDQVKERLSHSTTSMIFQLI